jgi:predicted DNA-binding transcriptional regulator AlpA
MPASPPADHIPARLLTSSDLAHIFGVPIQTIHHWNRPRNRKLPAPIRIGGVLRWDPSVIARFIKSQGDPNEVEGRPALDAAGEAVTT